MSLSINPQLKDFVETWKEQDYNDENHLCSFNNQSPHWHNEWVCPSVETMCAHTDT